MSGTPALRLAVATLVAGLLLAGSSARGLPPTPVRRQVLPPVPGYIPVYIQHGDVAPEDTVELAELFRVAGDNLPPANFVADQVFGASASTSAASTSDASATVADGQPASAAPTDLTAQPLPSSTEAEGQRDTATETAPPQPEAVGDAAAHEAPTVLDVIHLEPFPDKVEIGPDKLPAMIDASKMDAEESHSNNAEQTSPASQPLAEAENPTTEETTTTE